MIPVSTTTDSNSVVHYLCKEGSIDVIYKESSIVLSLSDKRIIDLPQVLSASGLRFENGGIVFVSKGDDAFMEENGKTTYEDCIVDNSGKPAVSGNLVFTDQGNTISFLYPKEFSVSGGGVGYTKSWRTNTQSLGLVLAKLTIPKGAQLNTNLSEATFTVGTSSDPKQVEGCFTPTNGEQLGLGTKSINGAVYVKFTLSDAGAGNFYDTTSYRTIRNSQCYSIEYTIHSTNIGAYSPDQGIKEFDKQKITAILETIVESFRFIGSPVNPDDAIRDSIKSTTVTPLEVVEDSRCHQGGQCIWAGTVKVKVRVVSKSGVTAEDVLTLSQPKTIAGVSVTLISVSPEATNKKLVLSDYKFEFSTK